MKKTEWLTVEPLKQEEKGRNPEGRPPYNILKKFAHLATEVDLILHLESTASLKL